MNVPFKLNAYFKTITTTDNNEDICDDLNSRELKFKYGDVNFQNFKVHYVPSGWLGRKIVALPHAAWSGIVKSTYHLAKAVFVGIPKAFFDKGEYFQVQCYHIARDFEASLGWLITMINDKFGCYLIEESDFQKGCYDVLLDPNLSEKYNQLLFATSGRTAEKQDGNANESLDELADFTELERTLLINATGFLQADDLVNALDTIEPVSDISIKEEFIAKVATSYLKKGNRKEAIDTIQKITVDFPSKNVFLVDVIKSYQVDGLLEEALEITKLIESNNTMKDERVTSIVDEYIQMGSLKKATAAIELISNQYIQRGYAVKVANEYV